MVGPGAMLCHLILVGLRLQFCKVVGRASVACFQPEPRHGGYTGRPAFLPHMQETVQLTCLLWKGTCESAGLISLGWCSMYSVPK